MRSKPQHDQHQQLELDLWQIFAVAQATPATANMVMLCAHLDGLDLIDGARAIDNLPRNHRQLINSNDGRSL
jgi:hypothetical protein